MATATEKEGSTEIHIPEQKLNVCNGCDHLRYNHDHNLQLAEYECKKDEKADIGKITYGYVITPANCPVKK